jgi:hypothetical protein
MALGQTLFPNNIPLMRGAELRVCRYCGKTFDSYQCGGCVGRKDAEKKAAYLWGWGLCVGFTGELFALFKYPTLGGDSSEIILFLSVLVIPIAMILAFAYFDPWDRDTFLVRLTFIIAGALLPAHATFAYLNGALDRKPVVEVQTYVSRGYVSNGEDGTSYVLVASVVWNRRQYEEALAVSHETYSFAETGDSLRLAIHPGAFSKPWYGEAVLSDAHKEIRFRLKHPE